MFGSERRLRRLFQARGRARPEHERELLPELMEQYDRMYPRKERSKMSGVLLRKIIAIPAVAVAVGAAACAAPADVEVDVGRSLEVRYEATKAGIEPKAVLDAIKAEVEGSESEGAAAQAKEAGGERATRNVSFRVRREGDSVEVRAEVWGTNLPEASLTDRIRQAVPALKDATIKEEHLQGKVRGTLGEKIGHELFNIDVLDETDVETARQQVMAELAARGVEGKVDVQIEGDGKQRKVKIRVEQEECDPPEGEPPATETQAK
jgi:hypothetical protein